MSIGLYVCLSPPGGYLNLARSLATDAGRRDAATEERKKTFATVFFLRVANSRVLLQSISFRRSDARLLRSRVNILTKDSSVQPFSHIFAN